MKPRATALSGCQICHSLRLRTTPRGRFRRVVRLPRRSTRDRRDVPIPLNHSAPDRMKLRGGIQPGKVAGVMQGADDGLLARFICF